MRLQKRKSMTFPGYAPKLETIVAVYRAIVEAPQSSIRELSDAIGVGFSTVNRALWALHDIGAITKMPGRNRAIVVTPVATYHGHAYLPIWLDIGD